MGEKSFVLEDEAEGYLSGIKDAGAGKAEEEKGHLSEIIEVLNERFGTEFKEADRLFFHQIEEEMAANTKLVEQAHSNTIENFKYGFEDAFLASLISRMDQNQEIFTKIMDDDEFSKVVKKLLLEKVYTRLRETIQF